MDRPVEATGSAGLRHRGIPRSIRAAALLLGVLGVAGCARPGPGVSGVVDLAPPDSDALRLVYLGSGGWILEYGDELLLTAPFFSNPGLVRAGLGPIESKPEIVDDFMGRYDVEDAQAILVGHAHYDHAMDVPRVALEHAPRAVVFGGRTVKNTFGTWSGIGARVQAIDLTAGDAETVGAWHALGPRLRVMALRSRHAAHFDGMTLYQGTRDRPMQRPPRTADEWLDGETLAFLIDFLDPEGAVAFRVYYQDAVVAPPLGSAPDEVIRQRPVDVAILVPATFDQVDWHPEALVENLQPRFVLLGHWEDFFTPIRTPARSIMLTDLDHFESRLENVFEGPWWRPDLWTEFRLPRR